jgi:AhpD family alkylhydroperoxidase
MSGCECKPDRAQPPVEAGPDANRKRIMPNHYHDENDLKLLKEMSQLAPEEFKAWVNLDRIVAREDGRIPRKYRELIALAVAHTTQCVYCIEVHTKNAKKAGASKEEVAEAVLLAAALRAGGAAVHGTLAMKFFDEA